MTNEILKLARRYAEEYMSGMVEPAHLLRACLHPDTGLVDFFETTLGKDYYYLVEWAEVRMSLLDKAQRGTDPELSDRTESVIREAETYAEGEEVNALHIVASLVTPGVGFSFEELKTLPLTAQEILDHAKPTATGSTAKHAATGTVASQGALKAVAKYCRELTASDEESAVVGFEREIAMLYEVLGRRTKANVLVTGDSGVGKTSLVRGFVEHLHTEQSPERLRRAAVYELDLGAIAAGATYKGEVEDRAKSVFSELEQLENVIVVVESVDKAFDRQDALYGVASVLKQNVARGGVSLLCTTTIDGYTKHIENDKEFAHKMERIGLEPPTEEQCFRIVKCSIGKYTAFHGLLVSDEVIREAIRLAKRYIAERPLPDSVFDLLDRTMSQVCIMNDITAQELAEFHNKLDAIDDADDAATRLGWLNYEIFNKTSCLLTMQLENDKDFDKCESVVEKREFLKQVLDELDRLATGQRTEVLATDLSSMVARMTGIPMGKVQSKERDRLMGGEEILKRRVIGQDHAIKVVLDAVYESRSGLNKKGQPMGSFFFLGPTGTGKTELSKSLVEFLFGDESALIRFDMSEFKEEHSVALLYGAPPGYVGYEEGGLLVNKIRQNPYSVVLFDEIEKAHKSVFDLFLQILDEGKLHDRLGRVGDFSNALILFTSNIGSQFIVDAFNQGRVPQSNELMDIMQGNFRPEFLGRLTEIVPFAPISEQTVVRIFDIHLRNLCKQLDEQHITLMMDDESKRALAMNGFNPQYGARPIIGIIRKEVRRPLATLIISGKVKAGDTVKAVWNGEKLDFSVVNV